MNCHPRTLYLLSRCEDNLGLSKHELKALQCEPIHTLPDDKNGFGLWGPTGTGKSWALVPVFVEEAERAIRNAPNPDNACPPYGFRSQWLNWPETANIWKRRPLEINLDVEHVKLVDRLFLDDIGGEVIKGCDDFSLGILREIVDYRYRHSMRTWWTSNLSPNELNDVYGARLASRLTSTWKPYEIEGIDLRIAK